MRWIAALGLIALGAVAHAAMPSNGAELWRPSLAGSRHVHAATFYVDASDCRTFAEAVNAKFGQDWWYCK
jgi:hypothetical protein